MKLNPLAQEFIPNQKPVVTLIFDLDWEESYSFGNSLFDFYFLNYDFIN